MACGNICRSLERCLESITSAWTQRLSLLSKWQNQSSSQFRLELVHSNTQNTVSFKFPYLACITEPLQWPWLFFQKTSWSSFGSRKLIKLIYKLLSSQLRTCTLSGTIQTAKPWDCQCQQRSSFPTMVRANVYNCLSEELLLWYLWVRGMIGERLVKPHFADLILLEKLWVIL